MESLPQNFQLTDGKHHVRDGHPPPMGHHVVGVVEVMHQDIEAIFEAVFDFYCIRRFVIDTCTFSEILKQLSV
jgi:hypothetical protein